MKRINFISLLLMMALCHPQLVFGQTGESASSSLTVLDEAQSMQLFREHNPDLQKIKAELDFNTADLEKRRLLPNPELSYNREQIFPKGGNSSEDSVTISWPFDLSGKRRLMRKAAKIQLSSEQKHMIWNVHFAEADFKRQFYSLLWAQKHQQVLKELKTQFYNVLESARSHQGHMKDYDRIRLEKEYAEVVSLVDEFEIKLHAFRSDLTKLMSQNIDHGKLRVSGNLMYKGKLPAEQELLDAIPDHPKVLEALSTIQAKELERRAASRRWIPELQLKGGYKQERVAGDIDAGYVAGISFSIPFFDRGQKDIKRAVASEEISRHELTKIKDEISALLDEAYEDVLGFRKIAREYERSVGTHADQLKQMAGVSYLEGKLSVLELIDAYHAYANTQLRLLALSLEVRLAAIELERATGRTLG